MLHLFFVCFLVPHPPSATSLDLMTNDSDIATDHLFAVLDRSSAAPADPKASNLLNLLNSSCLSPSFLFQRLQLPNDGVHKVTLYLLDLPEQDLSLFYQYSSISHQGKYSKSKSWYVLKILRIDLVRASKSDIQALTQDLPDQMWNGKGEAEKKRFRNCEVFPKDSEEETNISYI